MKDKQVVINVYNTQNSADSMASWNCKPDKHGFNRTFWAAENSYTICGDFNEFHLPSEMPQFHRFFCVTRVFDVVLYI